MSRLHALRIVTSLISAGLLLASSSNTQLDLSVKPLKRINIKNETITSVAMAFARSAEVTIGLEIASGHDDDRISLETADDSTVGAELDKLVRNYPIYQWKQVGNAISIFPKADAPSVFDLMIEHYSSKSELPVQMVHEIMQVPIIATYLSTNKVKPATWVTGSVPQSRSSIELINVSLREGLDEIAVSTSRLGWVAFRQNRDGVDYLWLQM